MLVKLVLPEFGQQSTSALIVRWLKAEGDPVEPGDPLVELRLADARKLDVQRNARLLTRLSTRAVRRSARSTSRQPVAKPVRITSAERCVLRSILVGERTQGRVGDVLALVDVDTGGSVPDDGGSVAAAPRLRIVHDL